MKLVRLLRLARIIQYMKFASSMRIGFKIFQLLFFEILLVHWLGCIFYLLINNNETAPRYRWMPPKDFDA